MKTAGSSLLLVLALASGCGGGAMPSSAEGAAGGATDEAGGREPQLRTDGGTTEGTAAACLTELPSKQTVTIVVTNETATDRFVATATQGIAPFSVEPLNPNADPLVLAEHDFCGCECNGVLPDAIIGLHRIRPGESFALQWDARVLVDDGCDATTDCGNWSYTAVHRVSRPIAPGSYGIGVKVFDSVPPDWSQDGDDFKAGTVYGLSDVGPSAAKTIVLSGSGDVSVELGIII
jgi:hypothetical protein